MKYFFFTIAVLISLSSCAPDVQDVVEHYEGNTITFIGLHDDPETEVVIKRMIRQSVMEDEYIILRHHDTIQINSIGTTLFMIGVRATVFDSIVVDNGDQVTVSVKNDSMQILAEKSDLAANLHWLNRYHEKVEDSYQSVFESIKTIPESIEEFHKPLIFVNDYEIMELLLTHVYMIDRRAYNQKKAGFDRKLMDTYCKLNSMIYQSELDDGSKRIMRNTLFDSTIDKFRRMGATIQEWMYDKINDDAQRDSSFLYTTNMADFYLNYLTNRHFQKITFLDLDKAYHKSNDIPFTGFKQEIQRVCLLKMFSKGNKQDVAKDRLNSYVEDYKDSTFFNFVVSKFALHDSTLNERGVESVLVDVFNKEHRFENLIKENIGNVLLIDFWASWCAPCRAGMPDVKKLEQKNRSKNFKVIFASIDKHPKQWEKASKDDGIYDGHNYWVTNWKNSRLREKFNITHIPRYIIYDKFGKVAYPNAPKPNAMEGILVDLMSQSLIE